LATNAAKFLTGRFISANWSVDDLMRRKDEILAGKDLKIVYQGNFGLEQFRCAHSVELTKPAECS
jgi:hypothetical protein